MVFFKFIINIIQFVKPKLIIKEIHRITKKEKNFSKNILLQLNVKQNPDFRRFPKMVAQERI